jgi:hypothetical protein
MVIIMVTLINTAMVCETASYASHLTLDFFTPMSLPIP